MYKHLKIYVVSETRKFNRGLSTLLHDELHWLDVPERVTFKLGLMTYRCLHGQAPATFRQPTPAHCASLSTQHIRSSGFSGCWSDGLELAAR